MSRSSASVPAAAALSPSLLLMLVLMLMPRSAAAAEMTAVNGSCDVRSCALLDASLLEEYVSGLNASLPSLVEVDGGNATLPPFGVLPSDWSRLLLLQNSQPEGTPLRESLLRLSRLVLAAYFDSQERPAWTDQLLTGHLGRDGGGGEAVAGAASEAESEDQQASNATSGSTAQKAGARINASPIGAAAYNNGGSQPSGGNFSGDEEDSTTSHYSALPTAGPNFNQTFSSDADNEADGSGKSNETSRPDDDSSAANEVLHYRSREEHRRRLEERLSSDELLPSLEFNSTKSVEEFIASAEGSDGLVDEFFATEGTPPASETEATLFASSEEELTLTKSLEDLFDEAAELGATPSRSLEEFFRSAEATTVRENPGDLGTAAGIPGESANEPEKEYNPTTMARLIPGEIAAAGDRSGAAAAIPTMPLGASAAPPVAGENRTSDRPDDLFSESTSATTQRRPGDDWNSTGSIEPASDGGNTPVTVRLRRSIPAYLRLERRPAAATTAQPVPPPASGNGARDSREEEEEEATSSTSRNRQQRAVGRDKRRTRKRAGAEPVVEGQYPSFDAREPGQSLLDEERSAENSGRSLD